MTWRRRRNYMLLQNEPADDDARRISWCNEINERLFYKAMCDWPVLGDLHFFEQL